MNTLRALCSRVRAENSAKADRLPQVLQKRVESEIARLSSVLKHE